MSFARIRYAYLKGQTWLYRRNYPKEVAALLGQQALKQSLKTSDAKVARQRAAEVNIHYEETVDQVLSGALSLPQRDTLSDASTSEWATPSELALARLRATLKHSEPVRYHPIQQPKTTVQDATRRYLILRQNELRPSGFKSVRYSVELFSSKYGKRKLAELTREDGREFLGLIAQLNPYIGKSQKTYGLSLDASVDWSQSSKARITGKTQHRIWSQVNHWLNWCVYEGELELEEVVGRPLRSSYNISGREEFVPVNDHALQWYIYSQEQSPCEGYVQRVLRFQERTGRIVSPYERDV